MMVLNRFIIKKGLVKRSTTMISKFTHRDRFSANRKDRRHEETSRRHEDNSATQRSAHNK